MANLNSVNAEIVVRSKERHRRGRVEPNAATVLRQRRLSSGLFTSRGARVNLVRRRAARPNATIDDRMNVVTRPRATGIAPEGIAERLGWLPRRYCRDPATVADATIELA